MNIIEKAVEKIEKELEAELAQSADDAESFHSPASSTTPEADTDHAGESKTALPSGYSTDKTTPPVRAKSRAKVHSPAIHIDLERLAALGFITPDRINTLLSEEFRHLKRLLLRRATVGKPEYLDNGNLVLLTSSLPGEGKTFNSINLAMSLALEVDRTVLLIDADVLKSDASKTFQVSDKPGLSNYLQGDETDLSKLLLKTNVDSLSLLPSGPQFPKLTEMLASNQMQKLVRELSSRYADRIIIFDSPPLLSTSSASILAGLMGQVLLVIEAVRTPQSAVEAALRHIGKTDKVSILFNKQREFSFSSYGHGYGYGYGNSHKQSG